MTTARDDESYTYKGTRTRWRGNDDVAEKLKQLGEYLIVGGYPEDHASRYSKLAYTISRHPESLKQLRREGRLEQIDGVGGTITGIIEQIMDEGDSDKMRQFETETRMPRSVLELTAIPRLGAKTVRTLYHDHGIDSLKALKRAIDNNELDDVPGIGEKTIATMKQHIDEQGV